jgi:hypothetical protein
MLYSIHTATGLIFNTIWKCKHHFTIFAKLKYLIKKTNYLPFILSNAAVIYLSHILSHLKASSNDQRVYLPSNKPLILMLPPFICNCHPSEYQALFSAIHNKKFLNLMSAIAEDSCLIFIRMISIKSK